MEADVRVRRLRPSETAWIAVLPCMAAIVLAIVVLGPPLGEAFLAPSAEDALWPPEAVYVYGQAEPAKQARFLIALLGAPLLAALVLAASRRSPAMRPELARALTTISQAVVAAGLVAAVLGQRNVLFSSPIVRSPLFPAASLAVAAALPALLIAGMRTPALARRAAGLARETRARRTACLLAAVGATAIWLLTAINTEGSIGTAIFSDLPPWAMADAFAILDGRTPFVDFYAMYGQLWAYIAAMPMAVLGPTVTVFSIVMTCASLLGLLAVYAILRRVVGSSALALALYLPVLATGLYAMDVLPGRPGNNAQIFSVWPMRYAGPFLLAWLTARHLDGVAPRRRWPLFLAAGLVVANNLEFGLGALAGTLAALACAQPPRSWRAAAQVAREAALGLLSAALLVSLLALVRSGELPDPSFLTIYPRIFGSSGYIAHPMATFGFHLAVYATYVAAIGTAVVRVVRGDADRLLTAMLAWSGVFGLAAASYFAGRSDDLKLIAMFSAWAFALALLVVATVRALTERGWRRPTVAELAVLAGFGLAAASLHQLPAPWSELSRLGETTRPPLLEQARATRFVAERTRPRERVAILVPMGHRIAYEADVVNVSPFALMQAIVTERQRPMLLDAIRREGAHKVFLPRRELVPAFEQAFLDAGFMRTAAERETIALSDALS